MPVLPLVVATTTTEPVTTSLIRAPALDEFAELFNNGGVFISGDKLFEEEGLAGNLLLPILPLLLPALPLLLLPPLPSFPAL